MHPHHWLEDVFGARANVRLLRLFARDPAKHWTERQAAQALGMSTSTAHAALRRLSHLGILEDRMVGGSHMLRLDPENAITGDVKAVFDREADAWRRVRKAVEDAVPDGVACYLFGSSTTGSTDSDSDVDLLVVAQNQSEAERVAAEIRFAVLEDFPGDIELIALGRSKALQDRARPLIEDIRSQGEQLGTTSLDEVLR